MKTKAQIRRERDRVLQEYEKFCEGKSFTGQLSEIEFVRKKFPKYSDYRIAKAVILLEQSMDYNDTKAYYSMHRNVCPEIAGIILLMLHGMTKVYEIKRMTLEERFTWIHLFGE